MISSKKMRFAVTTAAAAAVVTTGAFAANVTSTTNVNVRSGADTNSESLGKVKKDETYTRLGTEGDWSLIDYNGQNGYVKSEFLEVIQ